MVPEKVFFVNLPGKSNLQERKAAMKSLLSQIDFKKILNIKDKVCVKTHVGEVKNTTYISPELIELVISKIKEYETYPFLIETTTLYYGPRQNAIGHLNLAYQHGFTYDKVGAPFIIADGLLGNAEIEISIPGEIYKKVSIARDAVFSDAFVIISHPTGHIVTGFGACLKNLGMGLCSKKGKLQQHSSIKPSVKNKNCTFCKECIKWCPEKAIIEQDNYAFILEEKCIGCGECLSVCKFNAVKFNFGIGSKELQKRIAEYAYGAIINKKNKCVFINVLTDMTTQCDCMDITQTPVIQDIGILTSFDPVAIDQATLDLTKKYNQKDLGKISAPHLDPTIQLEHAEKIGVGSRKYELINL